jgi:hypothetical protein
VIGGHRARCVPRSDVCPELECSQQAVGASCDMRQWAQRDTRSSLTYRDNIIVPANDSDVRDSAWRAVAISLQATARE